MSPKNPKEKLINKKNGYNKGAWTSEEDNKLSQYTQIHGPKKWNTLAINSGLNRCGKSCRLRWLNYLRPNIKRGNISEDEEDLIIRLHRLLGNRWALIAGRIPGRTDNEIKNYWNSRLRKNVNINKVITYLVSEDTIQKKEQHEFISIVESKKESGIMGGQETEANSDTNPAFDPDDFFDFSNEGTFGLEWVKNFSRLDNDKHV